MILDGSEVSLTHADTTISARQKKLARKLLKEARDMRHLASLLEAQDQGRTFHLVSKTPSSNHWIHAGAYTTFSDYRFAIRARLNLLPTRTVAKRAGHPEIDTTCPKCHQAPESQQARNREPSGTAPTRQLWTEERRETFLEVADRVGWSNHTLIASHLGMTICQVRNFKTKFPHSRWRGPTTQTDTPEPTDSPGRTSPPEQRDLIEAEPQGEANSTGQRDLEEADPPREADPPGDAETNPPGDVETNPPEEAETDPPEQTDTPGQSDPAEQEDLPGVDTPGQSDSAEQEDLPEVDPPTEADPPGETIRPDPSEEAGPSTEVETSGEVDSPEEANPLDEAIDEVLQAAVDTAILAARPSDNRRGSGGECGGGCGGGGCGGGPSEIGEEGRTPRRPRTLSELAAEWSDISVDTPETTEDPSTPRERRGRGRRWRRRRGERGRGNRPGDSEGRRVETPDQRPPSRAGRRQAPRPTPSQANPAASVASSSRPAATSDSQPRPRHWLTLAYEEVTDDMRRELDDFVRQSLEALGGSRIDWAQFEGYRVTGRQGCRNVRVQYGCTDYQSIGGSQPGLEVAAATAKGGATRGDEASKTATYPRRSQQLGPRRGTRKTPWWTPQLPKPTSSSYQTTLQRTGSPACAEVIPSKQKAVREGDLGGREWGPLQHPSRRTPNLLQK